MIAPNWILLFSKKRGRWWVRLLAFGRYHHVKAIAYLPAVRSWLFYDVKFNGTRLMLAPEDSPDTTALVHDYLQGCDLVAMPRLPMPKRTAPHAGFWCTLAMKHLVGISTGALRPDRLWRDCIAAGGKPHVSAGSRRGAFIAARLLRDAPNDENARLDLAFRLAFGRPATEAQQEQGKSFLAEQARVLPPSADRTTGPLSPVHANQHARHPLARAHPLRRVSNAAESVVSCHQFGR